MTVPVAVLDSGVLERIAARPSFRVTLRDLLAEGWDVVVPAVVLAEAIRGAPTDAPTNQAVNRLGTVTTDEAMARRAGNLRSLALRTSERRVPSGIDAIVAAHAVAVGRGVVFTTDPSDLRRLLVDHLGIRVERP